MYHLPCVQIELLTPDRVITVPVQVADMLSVAEDFYRKMKKREL